MKKIPKWLLKIYVRIPKEGASFKELKSILREQYKTEVLLVALSDLRELDLIKTKKENGLLLSCKMRERKLSLSSERFKEKLVKRYYRKNPNIVANHLRKRLNYLDQILFKASLKKYEIEDLLLKLSGLKS